MKEIIKKYYLYAVIGIIAIVLSIAYFADKEETITPFFSQTSEETSGTTEYIYIDIKGEVKNPGVYKVVKETRLFQIINLAGGTTANADMNAVNLSLKLADQQVIYIPSFEDSYPLITEVILYDSVIININTASLELLDTLPGIGPSTAQAIIDYRTEFGFFDKIEDIINVPGIGDATFNDIKDLITC